MILTTKCSGYARRNGTIVKCGKIIGGTSLSKEDAEKWKKMGITNPISHGLCRNCYEKQMKENRL
jgi:hypothetical protein